MVDGGCVLCHHKPWLTSGTEALQTKRAGLGLSRQRLKPKRISDPWTWFGLGHHLWAKVQFKK